MNDAHQYLKGNFHLSQNKGVHHHFEAVQAQDRKSQYREKSKFGPAELLSLYFTLNTWPVFHGISHEIPQYYQANNSHFPVFDL